MPRPILVELRAVPGRALGSAYELTVAGKRVLTLGDPARTIAAVTIAANIHRTPEPHPGSIVEIVVRHDGILESGRVRWLPADVTRFLEAARRRAANAQRSPAPAAAVRELADA